MVSLPDDSAGGCSAAVPADVESDALEEEEEDELDAPSLQAASIAKKSAHAAILPSASARLFVSTTICPPRSTCPARGSSTPGGDSTSG